VARIVVENISKSFEVPKGDTVRAVRHAGFTVWEGELLMLVGPSGCGKSTTLRMIAGLEEMDEGTISIDGKVINGVAPADRDIAMVFQSHALYPHMTVSENMAFGLKLRGVPGDEIRRRVSEAAEWLGLTGRLERYPRSLSGGERQRVAVGRALVRRPKVFLLDEPFSDLDAPLRVQMRAELSRLHRRLGSTMIFVTHDQVEAMTLGDRIAVMNEGAILQIADPLTLYQQPTHAFVAGFIGSPPMNLFRGTLVERGGALWLQEMSPGAAPLAALTDEQRQRLASFVGKDIVLGLRLEDILDTTQPEAAPYGCEVVATAETVELQGAETRVNLTTGATRFVVRIPHAARPKPGEKLKLLFDMSRAQFFSGTDGKAIGP
jgi:multiple sugar transport system ATP-binding protein